MCSRIRGNVDLIDENGGFLFNPYDLRDCMETLTKAVATDTSSMRNHNLRTIDKFSSDLVMEQLIKIMTKT